jgi:hypothetical protein
MHVDLEEEQNPPSFKAARQKDKNKINKPAPPEMNQELKDLQDQIKKLLANGKGRAKEWTVYMEGKFSIFL